MATATAQLGRPVINDVDAITPATANLAREGLVPTVDGGHQASTCGALGPNASPHKRLRTRRWRQQHQEVTRWIAART